jgi:thiol:disulfide interchange protein
METFRQFLAFPLYASVAWLVWVYNQQTPGSYGVLLAQGGLILIALSIWIGHQIPHKKIWRPLVKGLAILLFLLALFIAAMSSAVMPPEANLESPNQEHVGNHIPFTASALEDALAGNNPIFINMTAAWCLTCKVNERVALATDSTQALLKDRHITYLLGDWTNRNPEITDFLEKYGRNGVPLYVYYGPRDLQSNKRPDPIVLPQLLTPGLVADVLGEK